ncbi:hypothetical protein DPMN_172181 [Dreissena polymorpha]|uniref:Uncharacterized protein n=1 Tax=Dreissena polymorpha TaxID=45954 RepID=A0A9D4IEV5_DREPO|nr:hypothetical protein DPMN_172181 [Dreissena polymorpha]
MATVRQYDGDNAIERWRHCDDTTATVRYDYRIVAPFPKLNDKPSRAREGNHVINKMATSMPRQPMPARRTVLIRTFPHLVCNKPLWLLFRQAPYPLNHQRILIHE